MAWFAEMVMQSTSVVCSMTDPICLCVIVPQNETDESGEAAINVPSLVAATQLYLSPWMVHWESVAPVEASRQMVLPEDTTASRLLFLNQAREWLSENETSIGTSTTRLRSRLTWIRKNFWVAVAMKHLSGENLTADTFTTDGTVYSPVLNDEQNVIQYLKFSTPFARDQNLLFRQWT